MLDFIVTIGPATKGVDMLKALAENGATMFRLNFSHNNYDWYNELFEHLLEIKKLYPDIKILADISGPSLRIITPERQDIHVKKGEVINFPVTLPEAIPQLPLGTHILFGEGIGMMEVVANEGELHLKSLADFTVTDKMHMHTKVPLQLPILTDKDLADINYLVNKPIDIIALSFINSEKPILEVRKLLKEKDVHWQIMSKIETQEAMSNVDIIVQNSDFVMVARGDLALEAELVDLPANQEKTIHTAKTHSKRVIVATQLLYSMVNNPLPSRAEINDIALAVKQGATGLMLSDETTIGKHPLAALQYLVLIAIKYSKSGI